MIDTPDDGWITLHRKVKGHWLYEKPFSRFHAWIDILLSVNHAPHKIAFDGGFLTVERGQMVTSLNKLAERWGWERNAVRRFLTLLQSDAMAQISCDSRKTVVTVLKWDFYQRESENLRQSRDSLATVTRTNNNVNNVNNNTLLSQVDEPPKNIDETMPRSPRGEREKNLKKSISKDSDAYKAAEYMATKILRHTPGFPQLKNNKREATLQRWAEDIDKLLRLDKPDFNEFKQVLQYSQTDDFWKRNILSGKKLREQYGTLLVRMGGEQD